MSKIAACMIVTPNASILAPKYVGEIIFQTLAMMATSAHKAHVHLPKCIDVTFANYAKGHDSVPRTRGAVCYAFPEPALSNTADFVNAKTTLESGGRFTYSPACEETVKLSMSR